MNATKQVTTFKVASVYVGTVVGAGFASGQEVLQFFGHFGITGVYALILTTLMFVFFGLLILRLGWKLNAKSYREVTQYAGGRFVGGIIDGVIIFFLFGALTAMAAGAGAIFSEQFGLPHWLGSLLMVGVSIITVILGVGVVVNSISFVVPILLVSVLGISVTALIRNSIDLQEVSRWAIAANAPVPYWPLSSLLYVSYNLVLSVAVLAPLGRLAGKPVTINRGAVVGGVGLGIGALAIHMAIIANLPVAMNYQIPMGFVASTISPLVQLIYTFVLLAEIYTTAVGSLYGFSIRFINRHKPWFKWLAVGTGVASFFASLLGFSTLVRVLYPAVGFAGLLMIFGLLYGFVRKKI